MSERKSVTKKDATVCSASGLWLPSTHGGKRSRSPPRNFACKTCVICDRLVPRKVFYARPLRRRFRFSRHSTHPRLPFPAIQLGNLSEAWPGRDHHRRVGIQFRFVEPGRSASASWTQDRPVV